MTYLGRRLTLLYLFFVRMLTYFRINCEQILQWNPEPDISTFIVIIKVVAHRGGGFTTFVLSNRTSAVVRNKYSTTGFSTVSKVSQFDITLETRITQLSKEMPLIGFSALEAFLSGHKRPFAYAGLQQVLEGNQ